MEHVSTKIRGLARRTASNEDTALIEAVKEAVDAFDRLSETPEAKADDQFYEWARYIVMGFQGTLKMADRFPEKMADRLRKSLTEEHNWYDAWNMRSTYNKGREVKEALERAADIMGDPNFLRRLESIYDMARSHTASERTAFNKYNPSELIGQAISLFDDDKYGTGEEGQELAEKLRDIARDAFRVWNDRER